MPVTADGGDLAEHLSVHAYKTVSTPYLRTCNGTDPHQCGGDVTLTLLSVLCFCSFVHWYLCRLSPVMPPSQGGGMSEASARQLFQQLVSALDWVHRCGIALRDVKCDNCLLAGPGATLKLADFGCSCSNYQPGGCCADKICGTPEYLAPEVGRLAAVSHAIGGAPSA